MGYLHIDNLYKNTDVLLFRECFALEKVDGTSAHVAWDSGILRFFAGGAKHETFVALFGNMDLEAAFSNLGHDKVTVYGECYGGKIQGGKNTYGEHMRFVAFDVKVGDVWLSVPNAHDVTSKLGLEFVHYSQIPTDLESVDAARDADSQQAIRNGIGPGKIMEGVVLRPMVEMYRSDGKRIIAKHKRDEFLETRTRREVNPGELLILEEANAVAEEWVTDMRLRHVLDKLPQGIGIEHTGDVIKAMIEDVVRESKDEIVDSKKVRRAVGKAAAKLFKKHLKAALEHERGDQP